MTQIKGAQTVEIQVPANGRKNVEGAGRFVRCIETTGDLEVSVNNGSKSFFDTGISVTIDPTSPDYTNIQLFNNTGVEITAIIAYGYGNVEDDRLAISNQALNVQDVRASIMNTPVIETVVNGAAAREVVAANANRINGLIRNMSSIYTVYLGNASAQLIPLAPNEVIDLSKTSYAVYAVNNNGYDVDLLIHEDES